VLSRNYIFFRVDVSQAQAQLAEYEIGSGGSVISWCIFPKLTMRALTLLPLLFIHSAFAAPASDAQIVLGETTAVIDTLRGGHVYTEEEDVGTMIHNAGNVSSEDEVETWVEEDREYVKQNGLVCTSFQQPGV
jgi:hypothetical protein